MGNLIQVTEPAPEGGTHETYYSYNVFNQLTNVSMPRGGVTQTRTFNYDLATARLTSATNPENGTVTYSYNTDGTLAYKIDAKGQRIDYTYDSYGRVTQAAGVTFYYDTSPSPLAGYSNFAWGRLAAVKYPGDGKLRFMEVYSYSRGGLLSAKKLRVLKDVGWGGCEAGIACLATDLDAGFAYNSEGRYLGVARYPGGWRWSGSSSGGCDVWSSDGSPSFTYTLDAQGRPLKMTASTTFPAMQTTEFVKDVSYGPGGEITQMRLLGDANSGGNDIIETRAYNTLGQMTRQTVPGRIDQEYRYTAGQNNGRISQMKDWISGEEVTYAYDALNRLIQAVTTGPEYGLNFSYDGFGNMTSQHAFKGLALDTNLGYNGSTNRVTSAGYGYDANGNLTAMPYLSLSYDVQNRLIESTHTLQGTQQYGYDAAGRRVWKKTLPSNLQDYTMGIEFRGPDGNLLTTCSVRYQSWNPEWSSESLEGTCSEQRLYFAGRHMWTQAKPKLMETGEWVSEWRNLAVGDRLGSTGKYLPYGYQRSGSGTQYATYTRDNTGLDYAMHRYYSSAIGRFTSPDPYMASGGTRNPQSWNRYAYVVSAM